MTAPTSRPPFDPPWIASRSLDVYLFAISHSAAAMKSSKTFCFFSFIPCLCQSSPYSPLHNIKAGGKYPATLITTADHDDRVVPAHSFKYAATLQEKASKETPILIRIDVNSAHGASSLNKGLETTADIYTFIMHNMGLKPAAPSTAPAGLDR